MWISSMEVCMAHTKSGEGNAFSFLRLDVPSAPAERILDKTS